MFSYNPSHTTDTDRVRFHINDKTLGEGPLPEGCSFQDEEIQAVLDVEGSWQRGVAGVLETLSTAWALHPSFMADGLRKDLSDIPDNYARQAKVWRDRYGYARDGGSIVVTHPIKLDGFTKQDETEYS